MTPLGPLTSDCSQPQETSGGRVVEVLTRSPESFEADRIEVHLFDVGQLGVDSLRCIRQQQVVDPSSAPDQDRLAVDRESAMTFLVEIGVELTNAEFRVHAVRDGAIDRDGHAHRVEVRLAQSVRPPQARSLDLQDVVIIGRESNPLRFVRREYDLGCECAVLDLAAHLRPDLGGAVIPDHRRNADVS